MRLASKYILTLVALSLMARPVAAQTPAITFAAAYRRAAQGTPAWEQTAKRLGKNDLAQLARLFEGIERLRTGRDDAAEWFTVKLPTQKPSALTPLIIGAGKGWLTRIRMTRLATQLRTYYRNKVEYPATLKQLTGADLLDAFGKPFIYTAAPRKLMPNIPRQRFKLRCAVTGVSYGDLDQTLKHLYDAVDDIVVRTPEPDRRQVFARLRQADGSFSGAVQWHAGEKRNGYVLWAVYKYFIIVAQGDVPRIVLKP